MSVSPVNIEFQKKRLAGQNGTTGLIASGQRDCCLNAMPIVGTCPEHEPVGPHYVEDADEP
jgi:hypothetical protein